MNDEQEPVVLLGLTAEEAAAEAVASGARSLRAVVRSIRAAGHRGRARRLEAIARAALHRTALAAQVAHELPRSVADLPPATLRALAAIRRGLRELGPWQPNTAHPSASIFTDLNRAARALGV